MDFGDLGDVTFEVEFKGDGCDGLYKAMTNIKCENKYRKSDFKVIINPPAVILFKDGKKYVTKAQDEPFDAERGLMVALLKSFGIGYSDLQKMLEMADYQKNISIFKTEYSADQLYKKAGMTQDTEIKYPKVVLDAIDELEPMNFWNDLAKKKRGRPRKTDNIDNYAKMLKEKGILSRTAKDEPAKPKAKRGRPRKFRKGDIIAIKRQKTYKYAKIANRAKSKILSATYEVRNVSGIDNAVMIDKLGWFLPSEVELIEKAK